MNSLRETAMRAWFVRQNANTTRNEDLMTYLEVPTPGSSRRFRPDPAVEPRDASHMRDLI